MRPRSDPHPPFGHPLPEGEGPSRILSGLTNNCIKFPVAGRLRLEKTQVQERDRHSQGPKREEGQTGRMTGEFWKEVENAFFAVAELSEDERTAYLEQIYRDREDVIEEVESLLKNRESANRLTPEIVSHVANEAFADQKFGSPIGRLVGGRYLIVSYIGSGGFA